MTYLIGDEDELLRNGHSQVMSCTGKYMYVHFMYFVRLAADFKTSNLG